MTLAGRMVGLLIWIVMIPVAAVVVAFAVSNRQPIGLDLWPLPYQIEAPVYLVVLLAMLAGFLVGGFVAWTSSLRRRRRAVARVKARAEEEKTQAVAEAGTAVATAPPQS